MSFNDELPGSVSQAQSVACLLMINLRYQLECCGEELIMICLISALIRRFDSMVHSTQCPL
ncbi:hypothetical protein YDC107_5461 [Escherichia phage YDC107_2]|nr:hypothetical protein YDC107_5461 [Escherichia phage YDC107_2]